MNRLNTLWPFLSLLLLGHLSFAQEKTLLNVVYEFSYVRDLGHREEAYTANMVLSLGKQSSRYCSERLYMENDKAAARERERQKKQQNVSPKPMAVVSGGPLLVVTSQGAIINEEIIKDLPGRKMTVNAALGFKTYMIPSVIPAIDWQIQSEKKVVGGYECQLAKGAFGGRTYLAWFTTALPFQNGPWKLSGLPGLILEARDEKNEVSFLLKEVSRTTDPEETTKSYLQSDYSIKTNHKAYSRAKAEFESDPEAVMAALAPNAKLTVKNLDNPQDQKARKVKKYNPIETD